MSLIFSICVCTLRDVSMYINTLFQGLFEERVCELQLENEHIRRFQRRGRGREQLTLEPARHCRNQGSQQTQVDCTPCNITIDFGIFAAISSSHEIIKTIIIIWAQTMPKFGA
ncbi:unnamed protein product [Cylicostephanus goldi]|uniref:Uncharacterized protein n=1 Tax=Cylicostephanus goldi TaxID=71465 RepID=A0A3P7MTH1_CYLGO|nr:unnamed protein product [Cylicostephanus goldi]